MADSAQYRALVSALQAMADSGDLATSLPFFTEAEVAALRDYALAVPMRHAKTVINEKGIEVIQDFAVCFPAPRIGALDNLANTLEGAVAQIADETDLLADPFPLNDMSVQNYPAGSKGIGIHRDGLKYRGLVFIATLGGESCFCLCQDRGGGGRQVVDDSPGQLVVLSAAGFAGREGAESRPLHFVDSVVGGRLSLGLRYNSTAQASV